MNQNKNSSKTKIEKSLNALVLIIVLLAFGLAWSIYYQKNQITAKAAGLERVSE
jgi:hypothetical protein